MNRFHLDKVLFIIVMILFVAGSVVMYSASTSQHADSAHYLKRHLMNGSIAIMIGMVFSRFPHQYFRSLRYLILIGIYVLLIGVLVNNKMNNISHPARWLYLGGFSIQVADFVRLGMIIFIADYLHRKQQELHDFKTNILPIFILVASVVGLIAIQPDLSSSLMIMMLSLILFYLGNVQISHISGLLSLGSITAILYAWNNAYMWQRILTFMNENVDVANDGFQVHHSLMGLAHGGIGGVGLGNSYVKALFLPEPHTDFVFSILGEEFGFIGSFIFLFLYLLMFLRGLRIARNSADFFSMLLAIGISFSLFSFAMVNIGVVTGFLPVTGLPLPLISYGGSNLLITAIMLGILFNISSYNESGKIMSHERMLNVDF
ncbi:MAG: putative lipid II flippase FtsW [Candidatus Marinimicrobia bacterium]|nr:putative lipid II flippase FtsW [Candidatus Neomarinimicrobiota bacterium]MCF7850116.1 putative lipid II flippase FtsW [Candidatus Neomarinimicrobiota bacterium]MCF7905528.1 putative lipid II flippase FtsW [Candidatus Neomarinimicrobiota bacterium]